MTAQQLAALQALADQIARAMDTAAHADDGTLVPGPNGLVRTPFTRALDEAHEALEEAGYRLQMVIDETVRAALASRGLPSEALRAAAARRAPLTDEEQTYVENHAFCVDCGEVIGTDPDVERCAKCAPAHWCDDGDLRCAKCAAQEAP